MKFITIAVIAVCCLAVVNAHVLPEDEFADFEFNPADLADGDPEDIEELSIIWPVIIGSLRTLKGMNCAIKGVLNVQNVGTKFLSDSNTCGAAATKKLGSLISAVNTVVQTTKAIVTLNDGACKNGDYNDKDDGNNKPSFFKCFWKMFVKVWRLTYQVSKVVKMTKQVPTEGAGSGKCIANAAVSMKNQFTQFPGWVKQCSKLTSG